jgi:hypothetical protein
VGVDDEALRAHGGADPTRGRRMARAR